MSFIFEACSGELGHKGESAGHALEQAVKDKIAMARSEHHAIEDGGHGGKEQTSGHCQQHHHLDEDGTQGIDVIPQRHFLQFGLLRFGLILAHY